ncbi:hypothetical protein VTJ04DRAFT_7023 [Mycothermus thermophilus]|uniref:uncharacterized protein n=1 Tax=Humicola insolens TaxID=85995 RepID=UPI003743CD6F
MFHNYQTSVRQRRIKRSTPPILPALVAECDEDLWLLAALAFPPAAAEGIATVRPAAAAADPPTPDTTNAAAALEDTPDAPAPDLAALTGATDATDNPAAAIISSSPARALVAFRPVPSHCIYLNRKWTWPNKDRCQLFTEEDLNCQPPQCIKRRLCRCGEHVIGGWGRYCGASRTGPISPPF